MKINNFGGDLTDISAKEPYFGPYFETCFGTIFRLKNHWLGLNEIINSENGNRRIGLKTGCFGFSWTDLMRSLGTSSELDGGMHSSIVLDT